MNQRSFTAIYQKRPKYYIGWIEEVPGANTQGKTLAETKENLKEALLLALEESRKIFSGKTPEKIVRETITIPCLRSIPPMAETEKCFV